MRAHCIFSGARNVHGLRFKKWSRSYTPAPPTASHCAASNAHTPSWCASSSERWVARLVGVRHKSSLHSPSHAFRTFCNDVRAPTASQIGARGEMRELESTAASRARGVPVLAAPLHNACPGAPRNAAIPSLVLAATNACCSARAASTLHCMHCATHNLPACASMRDRLIHVHPDPV